MRVIPSQLLSAQYEAWGASPTPVDFKELYTALEQGLVDGQENPAGTILDLRLYEVQKYMTESRHGFLHYLIVFHKPWFDAQPPAHQAILVEAMREAGQWQRRATRERDAEAMQRLKEAGVQVQTLTAEAREQLRQRSLQVHAQFAAAGGQGLLTAGVCRDHAGHPVARGPSRRRRERMADARGEPPAPDGGGGAARPGATPGWGRAPRHAPGVRHGGGDRRDHPPAGGECRRRACSAATSCTGPSPGRMRSRPSGWSG